MGMNKLRQRGQLRLAPGNDTVWAEVCMGTSVMNCGLIERL